MAGKQLRRELRKKRPFESLEQEAMLNILRTVQDLPQQRLASHSWGVEELLRLLEKARAPLAAVTADDVAR